MAAARASGLPMRPGWHHLAGLDDWARYSSDSDPMVIGTDHVQTKTLALLSLPIEHDRPR